MRSTTTTATAHFTDVTQKAGVPGDAYGMGVAVGDYDGDGFPDLYVTQYPHSILYHNNGDGTFTDVTAKAGVAAPGWATSAVWFDYDNDGRLDLFVCRFVDYSKTKLKFCGDLLSGERHYCIPTIYDPMPCWLFHNNGDGTFTDVSKESGIAKSLAKAWGVVAADINNDGCMDLYVTNDTVPNFLFANRGKGRFEEIGTLAGVGVSAFGKPRSGMGVDAADYDQDGWIDLLEANVDQEMYSLYHNDKNEMFSDVATPTGIGAATRLLSGWGLKFFDYDNDGDLDLLLCNGHPDDRIDKRVEGVKFLEPMLLFHNTGKGFENVSQRSGPIFSRPFVRTRHGPWRLRQRRFRRRASRAEQCRARPAAKQYWARKSLAGSPISREESEHRCHRRQDQLSIRRSEAPSIQGRRWQLSFLPRSAHGLGTGTSEPRSTGWRSNGRSRAGRPSDLRTCRLIATSRSSKVKDGGSKSR